MTMQHWGLSTVIGTALMFAKGSALHAQGLGPSGATARCIDGKFTTQRSKTVACSEHGGILTWYGLADSTHHSKPDVIALLEAEIAHEPPNSVMRADHDGSVLLRAADSAKVVPYALFSDYLDKEHQESGCRRFSSHCVSCTIPGNRLYCTNVAKWLPLPPF